MLRDLTRADLLPPGDADSKKCLVSEAKVTEKQENGENFPGKSKFDDDQTKDIKIYRYLIVTVVLAMFTIMMAIQAINRLSYCANPHYVFIFLAGIGGAEAMILFATGFMWILPKAPGFLVYRIVVYIISGILLMWLCIGMGLIGTLYLTEQCDSDTIFTAAYALILSWFGSTPVFCTVIYPFILRKIAIRPVIPSLSTVQLY